MNRIIAGAAGALLIGFGVLVTLGVTANAQETRAYTSANLTLHIEQVTRGRQAAGQHCSECHGVSLRGALGPALRESGFLSTWSGRSVAALYDYTRENMPPSAPGTLSDATYSDIMGFILSYNGFSAGEGGMDLSRDDFGAITLE